MSKKRTKQEFETAAKNSYSIAGLCRNLGLKPCGGNYKLMLNSINGFMIDTSHFREQGWNTGMLFNPSCAKPLTEILVKGSSYQSFKLKNRLLIEGLKQHKCESCGLKEWFGTAIPLELHHINGDNTDHRFHNLRLLCPNCHAQTDSYRRKNNKYGKGEVQLVYKWDILSDRLSDGIRRC